MSRYTVSVETSPSTDRESHPAARRCLIAAALGLASTFISTPAGAEANKAGPEVRHALVDARGKVQSVTGDSQAQWAWKNGLPVLQVKMRLRPGADAVEFEVPPPQATTDLGLDGHVVSRLVLSGPELLAHPTCQEMGLQLVPEKMPKDLSFLAWIKCETRGRERRITLHTSSEVRLAKPAPLVALLQDGPDAPPAIGEFVVERPADRVTGRLKVVRSSTLPRSRWSGSVGVGITYASYNEERSGARSSQIKQSQFGITPKAAVAFALTPRWDLGASAFGTALALAPSPSSLGGTRYFGLNLRAGYNPGISWLGASWKFALGTYFWGMSTESDYGISFLAGPQAFVIVAKPVAPNRAVVGYLKLAPTAENAGAFSLSNREVAIGGGFRWTSAATGRYTDLTLDLSNLTISSADIGVNSSLSTATVGIQVGW